MTSAGLDPGASGAMAVCGHDGEPLYLAHWRWTGRRWRGAYWEPDYVRPAEAPNAHPVTWVYGGTVPGRVRWSVSTLEKITPHAGRGNPVPLAEAAGWGLAILARGGPLPARPMPQTWRRDVLGLSNRTRAAQAEAAAEEACGWPVTQRRRKPVMFPVGLPVSMRCGHLAEAHAMALWGLGWRAESKQGEG